MVIVSDLSLELQYTVFLLLAPITVVITLGVIAFIFRYRRLTLEARRLVLLMGIVIGWLIFNSFELLAESPEATLTFARITYVFIILTPVCWLAFALEYAGLRAWLHLSRFWLFLVIPLISILMVWTNDYHHLVWANVAFLPVNNLLGLFVSYGPGFWVLATNSYALVIYGSMLIARQYFRALQLYRYQSRLVLVGAAIPILFNAVYIFRLVPGLRKDYTAIGFAISALTFVVGITRYRFLDLRPAARGIAIDTMPDPLLTVDAYERVIDLNPAALDLVSRLNPAMDEHDLLGLPVARIFRRWPAFVAMLEGEAVPQGDLVLDWGEEERYFECRVSLLRSRRERVIGRLVVLHDITERKATEADLRFNMRELRVRNEQLDAFAHTVAHDLKGPLAIMIGYIDMVRTYLHDLSPVEMLSHLDAVLQTGDEMNRIVDSLLLLARVYQLEDVQLERLDMGVVVQHALQRVRTMVVSQGAEVVTPEAAWPWVVGYMPWLEQVWVNYLTNAIKYGGTPPTLTLGFERLTLEGRTEACRFWVQDNGAGLSDEDVEKLFLPLTRLEPERAEGHGLGLSIVHRIVEKLGGQVGVDSVEGQGSTFWFALPVQDGEEET